MYSSVSKCFCRLSLTLKTKVAHVTKLHSRLNKVPTVFQAKQISTSFQLKVENSDEELNDIDEQEFDTLVKRTFRIGEMGHQVFVIQPYIKWGLKKKTITTPELQLDEAVALIKTLPSWKVVETRIVPLLTFDKPTIFGKGTLESLQQSILNNKDISCVFVSINMLNSEQNKTLEDLFKVPIYDRYSIVVQIFKLHATTKEAKLQVEMGQIPYLWSRLKCDYEGASDKMGGGATVGGPGETYFEIKRRLLQDKERKLKRELKQLQNQRELLRSRRKKLDIPIVAVVGYTNAGKTSLIKALTEEESLQPKDVLFATLDVSVHAGYLTSGLKVLFVDTVGFLSDIPTNLIQAFITTLEDALQADLIIHVQDVSHPDLKAQSEQVVKTLKSIKLPENLLESMITVANKVDLVSGPVASGLPVSSTSGTGIDVLKKEIETAIVKATGLIFIKIRVPNGGPEYTWLHRESTVTKVVADEIDNQFTFVNTLISEAKLNKFKHDFISSKVKRRKG